MVASKFQNNQIMWIPIAYSEIINRGKRLDGSYYDIKVKNAKTIIENSGLKIVPLLNDEGFIENAYYPKRFKRTYAKKGIPFIGSSEILKVNPVPKIYLLDKLSRY